MVYLNKTHGDGRGWGKEVLLEIGRWNPSYGRLIRLISCPRLVGTATTAYILRVCGSSGPKSKLRYRLTKFGCTSRRENIRFRRGYGSFIAGRSDQFGRLSDNGIPGKSGGRNRA